MPTGTRDQIGNEIFEQVIYVPAVTFPTIAADGSGTSTLTVPGVLPGDQVSWNMQAPPAHVFLANAYVSAANTLTLAWTSDSTGVSGSTMAVTFSVARPENASLGLSALPPNLV
jgi:hypothetical protein